MPFESVNQLIPKIQQQGQDQLKQEIKPEETKE